MSYIGNQPTSVAFLTDQFSGNGTDTVFTMSVAPATTSSILVAITGVVQDPSTYSVSGTTLTFSAAPPSGTGNISVRYLGIPASGVTTTAYRTVTEFTATAGQTTFTPPSYTVGYLNVYMNGVLLGSADYTATNGTTVVLASGAVAGALITTESFYVSSVLNAIPASPSSVGTSYLVDGSVTTTKVADANITAAKLASGAARTNFGAGAVLQVVNNDSSAVGTFTTTSTTPVDTGYSISITPSSTSSKIAIFFNPLIFLENAVSPQVFVYGEAHLYRGTTPLKSRAISVNTGSTLLVDMSGTAATFFLDSPNTTSTVTYRLYINSLVHAFRTSINSVGGYSNITLMEIAG